MRRLGRAAWGTRRARTASLAVAALAAAAVALCGRPAEVTAYEVARRTLAQRVVASGRVLPPARISLGALTLARVVEVAVDEGDVVRAGDVLVRLDDADASASLEQARGRVAEATARLAQVRGVSGKTTAAALRQAEVRVAQAEQDLARLRTLSAAGSASAAQAQDAERALALARAQAESAAVQAASATGAGTELAVAAAVLVQARGAETAARARLEDTRLRAPADGLVLVRDVEPGDVVPAGKALLVLARAGETRLSVQPDEKNLALLRAGQPASAVADAFPERPFRAEVTFIAPAVDPARGTVEVRLRVREPPDFLRPDMTVSVNVEVGRRPGALVLPADAVRDPASRPWVLRVEGGRVRERPVRLGIRGEGQVEILDGLAPGDLVVPPSARVVDGARVRLRARPGPAEIARAL